MSLTQVLLSLLLLLLPLSSTTAAIAKPNCSTKCGNITVEYPFGIGVNSGCSISPWFDVNCNSSFDPPKPFISDTNIEIVNISDTNLRIKNIVASACFDSFGRRQTDLFKLVWINLGSSPFTFSDENMFTVIGCSEIATITGSRGRNYTGGCLSLCSSSQDMIDGDCSGIGCCQTQVPKGLKNFNATIIPRGNHTDVWSFNPCGYAFHGDPSSYRFSVSDLKDPTFANRTKENVPVILDWAVGEQSCSEAKESGDFACFGNSYCVDSDTGIKGYPDVHVEKGILGIHILVQAAQILMNVKVNPAMKMGFVQMLLGISPVLARKGT